VKSAKRLSAIGAALGAVILAGVVIAGVIFRRSLDWGDFPTWVLAITTVLAVIAAAGATVMAYRLYKVESARDLAAAEDRRLAAEDRKRLEEERAERHEADRRTQANRVTTWFDSEEMTSEDPLFDSAEPGLRIWGAVVVNASDLPILDVRVFFYYVVDHDDGRPWQPVICGIPPRKFRVIPPGGRRFVELTSEYQHIPPGARELLDPDAMELRRGWPVREYMYVTGIEFSDAAGNSWAREARGGLEPRPGGQQGA
jgi:hypothetical protein